MRDNMLTMTNLMIVTLVVITSSMTYFLMGNAEGLVLLLIAGLLMVGSLYFGTLPILMTTLVLFFASGSILFYKVLIGANINQQMQYFLDVFLYYGLALIVLIIVAGKLHEYIMERVQQLKQQEERLTKYVAIDVDTGFDNQTRMMTEVFEEMRRADRYDLNFALVFFKIENYKEFKRLYSADEVLHMWKELARKIELKSRITDKKFRYKEDELVVLLTSTTDEYRDIIYDKFKEVILEHQLLSGKWITLSYRTAFYTYYPHQEQTLEQILIEAESEMKSHVL